MDSCSKVLRRDCLASHIQTMHKEYRLDEVKGRKLLLSGKEFEELDEEES